MKKILLTLFVVAMSLNLFATGGLLGTYECNDANGTVNNQTPIVMEPIQKVSLAKWSTYTYTSGIVSSDLATSASTLSQYPFAFQVKAVGKSIRIDSIVVTYTNKIVIATPTPPATATTPDFSFYSRVTTTKLTGTASTDAANASPSVLLKTDIVSLEGVYKTVNLPLTSTVIRDQEYIMLFVVAKMDPTSSVKIDQVKFYGEVGAPNLAFPSAKIFKSTSDVPFSLGVTSLSPGAITYTSSNEAVATVNAGQVTIVGPGVTTFTASQEASGNYIAASTTCQLSVGNASKTYTLINSIADLNSSSSFVIATKTSSSFYGLGFQDLVRRPGKAISQLSTTTNASGIPVDFTTTSAAAATDDMTPFEFLIVPSTQDHFTIKDIVNNKYLVAATNTTGASPSGSLLTQDAPDNANWTIAIDAATGIASMSCENITTYPYNILKFNAGASTLAFNCFDQANIAGKPEVYIYKTAYTPSAINSPKEDLQLTVVGKVVTVFGANSFEVFNVLGAKVKTVVADGSIAQVSLEKGVYIIRANNRSQKIVIK